MPADPNSSVVFGAENLPYSGFGPAECLDPREDGREPIRERFGLPQPPQRVVMAESEGRHPPLAFVLAELEGF